MCGPERKEQILSTYRDESLEKSLMPLEHFISTDARIAISEWRPLVEIIVQHSSSPKKPDEEATVSPLPAILSPQQIKEVLAGPFAPFIQQKLTVYAKIARLLFELHVYKEDIFKGERAPLPEKMKIPSKTVAKLSFGNLEKARKAVDELTRQHYAAWQDFIHSWIEKLIEYLNASSIHLTESEIQEMQDQEPVSLLLPHLQAREIPLVKQSGDIPFTHTQYLMYKAQLSIQSALSRQHQPHTMTDIQRILKNFKKSWYEMEKQEKQLIFAQKKLTDEVLITYQLTFSIKK